MNSLDKEISEVFGLVGLLFVFVIGYFSALLPQAEELISRRASDVQDERTALAARLRSYRKLTVGLQTMVSLVTIVLLPITRRVLDAWSFRGPFQTLGAGLLLVDTFLVAMFIVGVRLLLRLSTRIKAVDALGV
jgi:hypothetical protein